MVVKLTKGRIIDWWKICHIFNLNYDPRIIVEAKYDICSEAKYDICSISTMILHSRRNLRNLVSCLTTRIRIVSDFKSCQVVPHNLRNPESLCPWRCLSCHNPIRTQKHKPTPTTQKHKRNKHTSFGLRHEPIQTTTTTVVGLPAE